MSGAGPFQGTGSHWPCPPDPGPPLARRRPAAGPSADHRSPPRARGDRGSTLIHQLLRGQQHAASRFQQGPPFGDALWERLQPLAAELHLALPIVAVLEAGQGFAAHELCLAGQLPTPLQGVLDGSAQPSSAALPEAGAVERAPEAVQRWRGGSKVLVAFLTGPRGQELLGGRAICRSQGRAASPRASGDACCRHPARANGRSRSANGSGRGIEAAAPRVKTNGVDTCRGVFASGGEQSLPQVPRSVVDSAETCCRPLPRRCAGMKEFFPGRVLQITRRN